MYVSKKTIENAKTSVIQRISDLEDFFADPYLGYASFVEASDDCRASSQAEVLARLLNRENLFISGPAGSGKTTIIKKFISVVDALTEGKYNIAVTASTGMAASLIDGRTIHSWSGLGIFEGNYNPKSKDAPKIFRVYDQIKFTDVLIIDEISMLHAYYLDNLDALLKYVRRNKKPFGGIQVVFLGDFMQLPPVEPREPKDDLNYGYAITAKSWKDADITHCYMDKTHRATDPDLKHMLLRISNDQVDEKTQQIVRRCQENSRDKNKTYTTLFTTNRNVENFNNQELAKVPGTVSTFFAKKIDGSKDAADKLIKQRNIIQVLELKVGAVVIVTSNISDDEGIIAANGSVGKVINIMKESVTVRLNDGNTVVIPPMMYQLTKKIPVTLSETETIEVDEVEASVSQIPLKLGYAITVHKSQGQTFDAIEVDLSKCFIPGLGYVALSRVRELENLVITGMSRNALQVDQKSKKISTYVKKKALIARKDFLENQDEYTELTKLETLEAAWPDSASGSYRKLKASR